MRRAAALLMVLTGCAAEEDALDPYGPHGFEIPIKDGEAEEVYVIPDGLSPELDTGALPDAADESPADASPDDAPQDAPLDTGPDRADVARPDVSVDAGPVVPPGCASSASGASSTWTCSTDRSTRQRCVSGRTETVRCEFGCTPGSAGRDAVCSCGSMTNFTVWNCLRGDLYRCQSGAWITQSCDGNGCSVRPSGVDDVCNGPPPPPGSLSCGVTQWWNSPLTYQHMSGGWRDTDIRMAGSTRVQLRHDSRLDRHGVYGWGYMPEFTDLTTGARFRFLHLRPSMQNATVNGRVYPAGFIVGISGGDTADTGLPTYSTGAHLCVQTLVTYRSAFPTGTDACR